jgi:superfamily II DNA/RNA helicase
MTTQQDNTNFTQFNLPPALMESLARMNYSAPTPVQKQAIPPALQGRDILGSAQTGTGKTGAFTIPVIAKLIADPRAVALILSPTRELASQIADVALQMLGRNSPIRTALLVGGASMGKQFDQLRARPRLIIGTPGRINDHLRRNGSMLRDTRIVVLDEADRMLDMGFSVQIDEILAHVEAKERQTLMFSATFPASIIKFSQKYLNDPLRVSINPENVTVKAIRQETIQTTEAGKYTDLTAQLDQRRGSIIVFVRTKHGADRLARKLERENHNVGVIHGGLKQNKRDKAIAAFRDRNTRIMIATDVAARGLDVPHIEHVINYDLPQNAEDYVHRIGRTARAGAEGAAVSLLLPSDRGKWGAINGLMNGGGQQRQERDGGRRSGPPRRSKGSGRNHRKGQSKFGRSPLEQDQKPAAAGERPAGNSRPERNDRNDRGERNDRNDRNNPVRFSSDRGGDRFSKDDNRSNRDFRSGDFRDAPRSGDHRKEGGFKKADDFKKREGGNFKRGGFKKFDRDGNRPAHRPDTRSQKQG